MSRSQPTALLPRKRMTKALKVLSVGISSFCILLVSMYLVLEWSCTPPSLSALESRFQYQRKDLETIVSMSEKDADFTVIDPDWLAKRGSSQVYYFATPGIGMTRARWREYRRLFERDSITQGIRREPESGDAFVIVKSIGLLNRGYSNGYLHCGPGPKHYYPPCSSPAPTGEHPFDPEARDDWGAYSYKRLTDRWYVFSQGPS